VIAFPALASLPKKRCESAPGGRFAFVQYSSGTTGLRKGVAISHAQLTEHIEGYAASIGFTGEDRVASWLPLYHDMGLIACFLMSSYYGATSLHLSPFEWLQQPELLLRAISELKATFSFVPNFALNLLALRARDQQLEGV